MPKLTNVDERNSVHFCFDGFNYVTALSHRAETVYSILAWLDGLSC